MFRAIAGRTPFRMRRVGGDAPLEDRYPQLTLDPRPLPRAVPPVLEELVYACLAKDPEERPTAAELALALQPLVAAIPTRMRIGRHGVRMLR
jgi:hypothetical protein